MSLGLMHNNWQILGRTTISTLLAVGLVPSGADSTCPSAARIRTKIPALLEDWTAAAAGPKATLADARKVAETQRPHVKALRDPFTPLAQLTCAERLAKGERVVWEDAALMALVDFGNRGSTLLVVPKTPTNFPIDLSQEQLQHVTCVAAATCDALIAAASRQPGVVGTCSIYVSPPPGLSVRQMHVHVDAATGVSAPVGDTFLQLTAAHLRGLMGGSGCF